MILSSNNNGSLKLANPGMKNDTIQPPWGDDEPAFLVRPAPARLDRGHGVVPEESIGTDNDARKSPARRLRDQHSPDDPNRKQLEELIQRIGKGDQNALGEFYDRLSPTLFGLALRILKDEMASEDVLQEAFLGIWNKASTYQSELSSPFSWAVMIVRNKAIDRLRSHHRLEKIVERATEAFSHTPDFDAHSAEEPFFREQCALVRRALAKLPEEQRQAINLAFFGGLTHAEIAAQLNTPDGTIKSRIRRGLLELRGLVAEAR